jgi:hypothetical protein
MMVGFPYLGLTPPGYVPSLLRSFPDIRHPVSDSDVDLDSDISDL